MCDFRDWRIGLSRPALGLLFPWYRISKALREEGHQGRSEGLGMAGILSPDLQDVPRGNPVTDSLHLTHRATSRLHRRQIQMDGFGVNQELNHFDKTLVATFPSSIAS